MTVTWTKTYRPLLRSPHAQTILANRVAWTAEPRATRRFVDLPDGDRLALEVSAPPRATPQTPTVVLVHGLCGSHRSNYMVRLARRLVARGLRAVRMNQRGCGSGAGLARGIFHGGRSEDVRAVLEDLHAQYPDSLLSLVGFSLGGGLVLRVLGEFGEDAPAWLGRSVAVCPSVDLGASSRKLEQPSNWIYRRMFAGELFEHAARRHERFPDLGPLPLDGPLMSVLAFDDRYTAPQAGYSDADAYYADASAERFLDRIAVETHVLYAEDDPIVAPGPLDDAPFADCVLRHRTRHGGHLGFLARGNRVRFMDEVVVRALRA